jgi:hypothetical protein
MSRGIVRFINNFEGAYYGKACCSLGVNVKGKIHVERQEVSGMGEFSLFTDPEGRMIGLWKTFKKK